MSPKEETYIVVGLVIAVLSCIAGWLAIPQIQNLFNTPTATAIVIVTPELKPIPSFTPEPAPTWTSTFTPEPAPTWTPSVTPKPPTPTDKPVPLTNTPVPIPPAETPASPTVASILSVGQAWQQDGVVLHLQDSLFILNGAIECECVNFSFDLFNRTSNEILVTIEPWYFSAQDSSGRNLELVTMTVGTFCSYLRPLETLKTSIAPGDSFYLSGYPQWNVSFCGELTSSDYVMLNVNGLSGINNAKWKLPLK